MLLPLLRMACSSTKWLKNLTSIRQLLYVGALAATTGQPSFPISCDGDHLSYQIETKAGRIDALWERIGNTG